MQRKFLVFAVFILSCLLGCAKVQHLPQLLTLKSYGDHGDATDKFVGQTNALFVQLKADIAGEHLKAGTASADILKTYGNPVFKETVGEGEAAQEKWLYRHPTKFFKSDKVYLYFDPAGKLTKWDLILYVTKEEE